METTQASKQPESSETPEPNQSVPLDIAALQKRVEELEGQVKEKEAKYLYLYAEFENFKKRSIKERSDLLKFGWENVARELLQVVDNLERALAHVPPSTDKSLMEGLQMVLNQFRNALSQQGVQRIEDVGKPFDPNLHEALAQEPSELPEGQITQVHSRGYTLHGRLLRAARVVVSSGAKK
ncbi:MAG: nucleotide exchange factor GrpE [Oligoflexia bacterium]|nr:nucleotide exchange factor GrpE [Oligoflexia bacterium]